jgi:hypothetical protein
VNFCPYCGASLKSEHRGKFDPPAKEDKKEANSKAPPTPPGPNDDGESKPPYVEFVRKRLEEGVFDRKEFIAAIMQGFPEVNKGGVETFLSDMESGENNAHFNPRQVINHPTTGKLIFADRVKPEEETKPKPNSGLNQKIQPEPAQGPKLEPGSPLPKPRWKLIAAALMVLVIIGYFLINNHSIPFFSLGKWHTTSSLQSGGKSSSQGPREAARVAALDALRQGTLLSISVSKVPKLEKVVQAARKLLDISQRYKAQVDSSEAVLNSAKKEQDKLLISYVDKVIQLGQYSPSQISYALDSIKYGDITNREKIVAELISMHVRSLQNGASPDPRRWLADFTHRFSSYAD